MFFLFAAYGLAFALLAVYLGYLGRQLNRLEKTLAARRGDARGSGAGG